MIDKVDGNRIGADVNEPLINLLNQLILPVHDSFIVQRKNLVMLIESMDAAYKRVANTTSKTYMKMNIIEQNLLVVRDVSR